jgi:site-specific recombinase XerD
MLVEIAGFINWQRRRNATARTWRDYGYDLKQFVEVVGDRPPSVITFRDIDQFIVRQAERGFKAATINRRLAAIASLYTYLCDEDPTLISPVLPRRHGVREPQRLPRPVPH